MTSRIRLRRDTAANWTSVDPVLAAGEIGLETDTALIKIGDGSTAWSSLAYLYDTRISDIEDDVTALQADVTALEALPIATRCLDDSTDSTATTSVVRILGQRTAVGLTTKVLSSDTVYAVIYEPTGDELDGNSSLSALKFSITAGGDHAHIGIWQMTTGYPLTLIADSGALTPSGGIVSWTPTFTPTPGRLYVVGILVNASTTVRALSGNGCAMIGLDAAFGTSAYTHYTCSMTYGALSDFNTPVMGTGVVPAIGALYS